MIRSRLRLRVTTEPRRLFVKTFSYISTDFNPARAAKKNLLQSDKSQVVHTLSGHLTSKQAIAGNTVEKLSAGRVEVVRGGAWGGWGRSVHLGPLPPAYNLALSASTSSLSNLTEVTACARVSRGAAPALQLFTDACPARVFLALADRNSLRDRRWRWQTSCDMSMTTCAAYLPINQPSHLDRTPGISHYTMGSGECCLYSQNGREMRDEGNVHGLLNYLSPKKVNIVS
ncbi:unnamed protein product [Leptosia nina]|uniref:Uncharacterized protein n=1 Tax=Leptosia nina TaxID=320188 RepID=A0AAV1JL94_9NEOP